MTSDIFHAVGKIDDSNDRFTMSVKTRVFGSASLITDIFTLSYPRALLDDKAALRTS